MITANVFEVKRFSVNDGDGIRTTIFLKGCPLRCRWCQNPEGLLPGISVWYAKNICVSCKSCVAACPEGAIDWDERGAKIDQSACTRCGKCVVACPTGAIRFDGAAMSVEEALHEAEKDRPFYGKDGGVTLSGGECMASPGFSLALLAVCRERGIGTSIETSLYADPETADAFAAVTDLILADIKIFDGARHKSATGVDNARILENAARLMQAGTNIVIRTPLIPGFTDDEENIDSIASFVAAQGKDTPMELLNFNPMCRDKYEALRIPYPFSPSQREIPEERIEALRQIIRSHRVRAL